MAYQLINSKIIMRNDTPQAWNNRNPILSKGEVGCAIDEATGIVTFKVGDGIHHWRDLEIRPGTKEHSITYATAKGCNTTLDNMPIQTSGYSHAEGKQSMTTGHYAHAVGRSNYANTMQEAIETMAKTASMAGISIQEAATAFQNLYAIGGNAKPIRLITEGEKKQNQEYHEAIAPQKTKAETKNPYLEGFDIPHYDFEDMDIKDLIDF